MVKNYWLYIFTISSVIIFNSCKKDNVELCLLVTNDIITKTETTAICGGIIKTDGGGTITARGVCWSTTNAPTISDNKTVDGKGLGSFTSEIKDLSPNTKYYIRAYAKNNAGIAYGDPVSFITYTEMVTDIDGNTYGSITIGTQVWMAKNLMVTKYRNGDPIPCVTKLSLWNSLTTGSYCYYNFETPYINTFGLLYNWFSVNDKRNIAPVGWHIPSINEFKTLIDFLGGVEVAGGKLKEKGVEHWLEPNCDATDEYDFKALPGGNYEYAGFHMISAYGYWWSSTEGTNVFPYNFSLSYNNSNCSIENQKNKTDGLSIRCIKD